MQRLLPFLALAACGDGTDQPPEPTGPDIQFEVRAQIPAGTEVELCKFVTVDDAYVTRDEIDFGPGSHHVLVFQTPYTSIPTHKDGDPTPIDTSGVFDCSDGATNGWSVTKVIGGSQNANGGESLLDFPPGVALHISGVLLVNIHYINALDTALDASVDIGFYSTPAADVVQEGDILFLYNPLIGVPPGGTSRSRWRCPVYSDITIANVQSHMHARGIGYAASIGDAAPFYTNDRWEQVPVQRYDDLVVPAGASLDYYCDYRNTTGASIYQGPRTTDEMCMLIGSYYPADPRTANCLDESGTRPGGDWIGNGSATCAQTLQCMQGAGNNFQAITDCMLAASPAVSRPSSDVLRCFAVAADPATECAAQIAACAGS